jgi:parvulin-like peptidyl-prolyl isomerase
LLLIVYGYYTDRVAPRGDVVFQIGERKYTYAFLEDRVKSDVAQGRFNLQDTANSITATIARVQREELTRGMGRQRGITVSDAEIDDNIRTALGLPPESGRNEIATALREELLAIKLPLDEYLAIAESRVIEDKIKAELTASLPEEAEQVDLLFIQAGSQANAIMAKRALDEGVAFGEVAAQYSQHTASRSDGAFGWTPRELLDPELAEVAFSTTGRSGIIETEQDFYIIEVLGKETRPIDPAAIEEIQTREFNKLLEAAFEETTFLSNLTDRQLFDLANSVGGTFG